MAKVKGKAKAGGAVAKYTPLGDLGEGLAERLGRRPEPILIGSHLFGVATDGIVSLTEIWKAGGSLPSKRLADWLALKAAEGFRDRVAELLKVSKSTLFRVGRGRGSETVAHWEWAYRIAHTRRWPARARRSGPVGESAS